MYGAGLARGCPALTGLQAPVLLRELHSQAELQCQLGLSCRTAASQLRDAVQGQPATQEPVQPWTAEAQTLVLRGEVLPLLVQLQHCGDRWLVTRGSPGSLDQGH